VEVPGDKNWNNRRRLRPPCIRIGRLVRRVARREAAVVAFATVMAFIGSLAAPSAHAAPVTHHSGVQVCVGADALRDAATRRELAGT
jgi:hypothetical protein